MAEGSRSSRARVDRDLDNARLVSTPPSLATWSRWLTPSIADTIFIAFLAVLTCTALSVRLLGDAGIGWHIRTGQQILATDTIPRVDSFSAVMQGKTWYAWEWLYDVVAALADKAGLNGVVWLTAVVIAAVFAATFQFLLRRGANVFVALVLVLLAASASMIHFLARPHVVSWLFTLVWFWILDSSEKDSVDQDSTEQDSTERSSAVKAEKRLWLLPVLMLVWVNTHGGFLIGFVLLAIFWVSAVWQALRFKGDKFEEFLVRQRWRAQVTKLAAVGLVAGIASLVNPYGLKLYTHIYGYLSNRFFMAHIDEFQSPNFHGVAQKCFAVLILTMMVALAARGRELRASEVLVILFALYSGFYASRNIPVSSLLLALVIGPLLTAAVENLAARRLPWRQLGERIAAFASRMTTRQSNLTGHFWPIVAVGFTLWIAIHGGTIGSNRLMDAHFDARRFPAAAVDFLDRKPAAARYPVTVPDYWGGYLIYRLYPRTLVMVDDRHDLYGEEFLKLYLKMVHVTPGWNDFLEKYGARCVLVPKESALANILELTPAWKKIYADDVAVIFER